MAEEEAEAEAEEEEAEAEAGAEAEAEVKAEAGLEDGWRGRRECLSVGRRGERDRACEGWGLSCWR